MTPAPVALCFPLRTPPGDDTGSVPRTQVLLGLKKTGFGRGRIVGVGGHLEPGENPAQAACREVAEEIFVVVEERDLVPAGIVDFVFPSRPEWDMHTTIFLTRRWTGEPRESEEIEPAWYDVERLPRDRMWADAEHWLPRMLAGEAAAVVVTLNPDNETVAASEFTAWEPR